VQCHRRAQVKTSTIVPTKLFIAFTLFVGSITRMHQLKYVLQKSSIFRQIHFLYLQRHNSLFSNSETEEKLWTASKLAVCLQRMQCQIIPVYRMSHWTDYQEEHVLLSTSPSVPDIPDLSHQSHHHRLTEPLKQKCTHTDHWPSMKSVLFHAQQSPTVMSRHLSGGSTGGVTV
jgi:hypothetical protein